MNNIEKLERRWFFYKVKKYIKFLLGLLLSYSFLGLGYYAFIKLQQSKSVDKMKIVNEQNSLKEKENKLKQKEENLSVITTKEIIDEVKEEKLFLEAVIPIVEIDKERKTQNHRVRPKVTTHPKKKRIEAKKSAYLTKNELDKMNHVESMVAPKNIELDSIKLKKISIKSSSVNYIEIMKNKFNQHPNSRDALLLAGGFYEKKDYKQAELWALKANKMDAKLEESWLLFAKAKAKLGRSQEAIQILVSYYKKSDSSKARLLIEKIKKERL